MIQLNFRWMLRRDLRDVSEMNTKWRECDFLTQMKSHNNIGIVVEVFEEVIGFIVCEIHEDKVVLKNIAVKQQWRRCGVAKRLLQHFKEKLNRYKRTRGVAYVNERDLIAQLCLRSVGFVAKHILRNEENGDDLYEMVYKMDERVW